MLTFSFRLHRRSLRFLPFIDPARDFTAGGLPMNKQAGRWFRSALLPFWCGCCRIWRIHRPRAIGTHAPDRWRRFSRRCEPLLASSGTQAGKPGLVAIWRWRDGSDDRASSLLGNVPGLRLTARGCRARSGRGAGLSSILSCRDLEPVETGCPESVRSMRYGDRCGRRGFGSVVLPATSI